MASHSSHHCWIFKHDDMRLEDVRTVAMRVQVKTLTNCSQVFFYLIYGMEKAVYFSRNTVCGDAMTGDVHAVVNSENFSDDNTG